MKKFLSLVMVFALTMAMSVTAFAAGSPSTEAEASAVTDASGNKLDVKVEVNKLDDKVVAEAAQIAKDDASVVNGAVSAGVIGNSDYETAGVLASVDVVLDSSVTPSAENPVNITFNVNTAKSGDIIVAAHKKADGTWEYLPTTVKDGQVTVKFTSLSPVVFIKLSEKTGVSSDDASASSDDSSALDDGTSPKTGVNVVYYAELLALVSLAGACVCARRARR